MYYGEHGVGRGERGERERERAEALLSLRATRPHTEGCRGVCDQEERVIVLVEEVTRGHFRVVHVLHDLHRENPTASKKDKLYVLWGAWCREGRERGEREREKRGFTFPSRYTPPYSGLYRGMWSRTGGG